MRRTLRAFTTPFTMIGALTGHAQQAAAVIEGMKTTFAALRRARASWRARAFYSEVSPLQYGLWTAGSARL
jgi:iron complex transport system substrate-binding protein